MNIKALLSALIVLLAVPVVFPSAAHADGGPVGADILVAQTLGSREITVVIRRVAEVPGPVRVEVVTHRGSPPGTLDLSLSPSGTGTVTSGARLALGADPGLYGSTLAVDRPGPWEIAVGDGERTARIPFVVPARVFSAWERASYGGFAAAGVCLLGALTLAVRSRRAWPSLVSFAGMIAALAVAVTAALLSAAVPPPAPPGTRLDPTVENVSNPFESATFPKADYSRPPVNVAVHAPDAVAKRPAELRLSLTDTSTGLPADDFLVHHDALMHLIVVGPSGELWHLHPIRVAPGDYRVSFVPPQGGAYAVSAEVARRGGGVQLARSPVPVQVAGLPAATAAGEPAGLGSRVVDGVPVRLAATSSGSATTITARIGDRAELQPWLGMIGHLIVIGPFDGSREVGLASMRAPTWAHAHAMPLMSNAAQSPPDETVAAFGPDLDFTHTFTAPGRYRLWLQAERDYTLLTIPFTLDVPAKENERR
ncbi:hypothetical protein [Streptosporangium carneum]|uniref:Secreted protein n=1 Tax=Streptosporangium carneum TaxID=47481 RepID=A0A9W6I5T3_9ACTN|nr:hypothetical protein [Streptosporangium carneum]GLK12556.1 hypothetical protein GCM10017600_59660 [Streptosporangium carneum]